MKAWSGSHELQITLVVKNYQGTFLQTARIYNLRKGKLENDCKIDGIIWQGGRKWSNGLSWLKTAFDQRLK